MKVNERIKYFRNRHNMTQKNLGLKLGFPESTAGVRIAQYENGSRTPKKDMLNNIAEILDVSPQALDVPNIDDVTALMHSLFAIEDIFGLRITLVENEICLIPDMENKQNLNLCDSFGQWYDMKKRYISGEITTKEYDNWRYNFLQK